MFEYNALVTEVYDGDTITVDIDLGFNVWVRGEKIRLYGIDAPELTGSTREAGLKTRDRLRAMIAGRKVQIQTIKNSKDQDKKGKYGRYLAQVLYRDETGEVVNAGTVLVAEGLAVYKVY